MGEEINSENIGSIAFALGLIFGGGIWTTIWILAIDSIEIDLALVFTQGIGLGILIGTITALGLIKGWYGEKEWLVVPFGMGWGTAVGIVIGLTTAWSMEIPYIDAFSLGASAGLITGLIVGTFLWMNIRKENE
ncbi:MAG: hypothetical protein ACLFSM_08885 [Thermoplasmata archaeon]